MRHLDKISFKMFFKIQETSNLQKKKNMHIIVKMPNSHKMS